MFKILASYSILLFAGLVSVSHANLEALFICYHQSPHGERHVKTEVTVLGNLNLDAYVEEGSKFMRKVMISQGKEYLLRKHVYNYNRSYLDGEMEVSDNHLLITESFGKSYLKISRKPFKTEDGFGVVIPKSDWQYLAELVLHEKDGYKDSGKTVNHSTEINLSGDSFINLLKCSVPHGVDYKRSFNQFYD